MAQSDISLGCLIFLERQTRRRGGAHPPPSPPAPPHPPHPGVSSAQNQISGRPCLFPVSATAVSAGPCDCSTFTSHAEPCSAGCSPQQLTAGPAARGSRSRVPQSDLNPAAAAAESAQTRTSAPAQRDTREGARDLGDGAAEWRGSWGSVFNSQLGGGAVLTPPEPPR